jgi:hypothetical protein
MRHQFGGVGEAFATHGTFSSRQRSALFGVRLHVPIYRHLGSGLEFTKATLEFFDCDFMHGANVLLQKSAMLGHVSALTALITWLGRPMASISVNVFDVNIHVLFPGTFVVTIRTIKRLETFMH